MCVVCEPLKVEKAGEFLLDTLNKSGLSLILSLGHQTGLLENMKDGEAYTSVALAEKSGLHERYIREWLAALACGGIVDVDATGKHYNLKPEYIALLTSEAGAEYIAHFFQFTSVFAKVEQGILNCFKQGGGLPYEAYDRFHAVMAEESGMAVVNHLVSKILPLDAGLIPKLEAGARVVDIGCGSGKAMLQLAKSFPLSQFRGYDLCPEPLVNAREEAIAEKLHNLTFEELDLAEWNEEGVYDLITAFDVIHDQAHPDVVLHNAYRALKEDGIFLVVDIDAASNVAQNLQHPIGTILYTASLMHCMSVSLAQGGMGLGTMWGRQKATEMFREAGFSSVQVHTLEHDIQNCYYILKK